MQVRPPHQHGATLDSEAESGGDIPSAIGFGPFNLYPGQRRLERAGEAVLLGGRALDLLTALIAHAPNIVPKDELMRHAWGGVVVGDEALRYQLTVLRRVLGDDPATPEYISTVRGRGYGFVAELRRAPHPSPASARPRMSRSTNLRPHPHPLVGRRLAVETATDLLGSGRLLTLIGVGGVGKTRLATELGLSLFSDFPDGAWIVDLAPVRDDDMLPSAVAAALDLSFANSDVSVGTIAKQLQGKRLLLILDGCEHLIAAVGRFASALLTSTDELQILITSQISLRIAGEVVCRVEPLALDTEAGGASDAARLFLDLARQADESFMLADEQRTAIEEICRRLGGVPLALEMAAARVPLVGVENLKAVLGERLNLLRMSQLRPETRYRTLKDVLAWSCGLLSDQDRRVFSHLAVFRGPFTMDAVVAVEGAFGFEHWDTLDALSRLKDMSLLATAGGEPPRLRLLDTMRLYAAGLLSASDDADVAAEAHARFFNEYMRAAGEAWPTTREPEWMARHLPAIHDLRAAIDWLFERPDLADIALELTSRTLYLFIRNGLRADCRRYAETAITQLKDTSSPAVAARLLRCSAWALHFTDRPLSRARALQAARLAQQAGDLLERGFALATAARHAAMLGFYDEATNLVADARQCMAAVRSGKLGAQVELAGGLLAMCLDDAVEARRCYMKSLDHARSLADRTLECFALINLAEAEFAGGDAARAIEVARQALESPTSDDGGGYGWLRVTFATYQSVAGDLQSARDAGIQALAVARDGGAHLLRYCLQQWTLLGAREGRVAEAAALQGFVNASYVAAGESRQLAERTVYNATLAYLRESLPDDEVGARMSEGASWREDEAVAFVLNRLIHADSRANIQEGPAPTD